MPRSSTPRGAKPKGAQAFTKKLLAWYARAARDLPWRRTRDPYRVLVSEVMLQQTQVSRVAEYYPRFLERFPDLETLASARPKAVREAWDGLGYYARASNLHALARVVSQDFEGRLPDDPAKLVELPGVGPYTAGAVASFAYEKPVPAVDTNVSRVIRRVFFGGEGRGERFAAVQRKAAARRKVPLPSPLSPSVRDVWSTVTAILPKDGRKAWRFNQAMMELGALVCTARRPKCGECPVQQGCRTGRRLGRR